MSEVLHILIAVGAIAVPLAVAWFLIGGKGADPNRPTRPGKRR